MFQLLDLDALYLLRCERHEVDLDQKLYRRDEENNIEDHLRPIKTTASLLPGSYMASVIGMLLVLAGATKYKTIDPMCHRILRMLKTRETIT